MENYCTSCGKWSWPGAAGTALPGTMTGRRRGGERRDHADSGGPVPRVNPVPVSQEIQLTDNDTGAEHRSQRVSAKRTPELR
jgi:hypothetical protein